jgi:endogenous inhibitor of DNA gyrase (YacG/DUF329 family)
LSLNVKCTSCGANVSYEPGTAHLTCQYCHHTIDIELANSADNANQELDLNQYLNDFEGNAPKVERILVNCSGCGANTELEANQVSGFCPFCDTPLVIEQASTQSLIKPAGLLPFSIDKKVATDNFKSWVSGLWFAPNALKKKSAKLDNFKGIYLPFWTYDCDTGSHYDGQRGTYYYVEVSYRDKEGNNKTRRERRTSWHHVSGYVSESFDDVLIPATTSVPEDKLNALQPWDLADLVDYKDEYISGYLCESYSTDLKTGYQEAKVIIDNQIRSAIRSDIGGDEQRISSVSTQYSHVTFKHLLLPVWVSAYRYKEKVYQILVNARTGEVQGERPWSWVKISAAVMTAITIIGGCVYWYNMTH